VKALIIAAGEGCRLGRSTTSTPKPLIQLLGRPLIERVMLTARQAGITEFIIVVGYLGDKIRARLGDGSEYGVRITYVENREWKKGNGVSVLKARDLLDEPFVLLMSDHLFDVRILRGLVGFEAECSVVLAVDRREPLAEDTKVLARNGRIVSIGKHIEEYNCVDTGIFLCSPMIFAYIEVSVQSGRAELADGIAQAARAEDAEVFDVNQIDSYDSKMRKDVSPWWIDIDTVEDLKVAERLIIENASKNPSDALACYVHKPIENRLVGLVSKSSITPNQLTVAVNILAYLVTGLFLTGHLLAGSILSFVVGIADGLDGKLARVTMRTSRLGSLEHSFDLLFEFSWLIALALFLLDSQGSATPLILCTCIITLIAFYRNVYDRFRKATGVSLDDYGDLERVFRRVAGRRNLYNVVIFASVLLGVPLYSLVFILFHAGITAVVYAWRAAKHLHVLDRQGA